MQSKRIFIVVVSLLSLLSCKKEQNTQAENELAKLPAITQTGANTFGCLVNGNAVVSNNLSCSYEQTAQLASGNYFDFTLIATDSTSASKQTISLYVPGMPQIKDNSSYNLNAAANAIDRWYADYNDAPTGGVVNDYQTTLGSSSGVISFSKIDTVNKVLSGTFSFVGVDSDNQTVPVTSGRFDVHYSSN